MAVNQSGSHSDGAAEFDVSDSVSDHPASTQVDWKCDGPLDLFGQAWSWFAAVALVSRLVWADGDCVECYVGFGELFAHVVVEDGNVVGGVHAACDSRLIGGDRQRMAVQFEQDQRIDRSIEKTPIGDAVDITVVYVDGTVPIQKDHRALIGRRVMRHVAYFASGSTTGALPASLARPTSRSYSDDVPADRFVLHMAGNQVDRRPDGLRLGDH